ncbi:MAG: T9SS type A sorting domain-containing protein, partial [Chitinophagaceae bacterium]
TVIRRGHVQQAGASVFRYFDITPTTNTGLNASINFYYFDTELGVISESNLGMFSSANGGTNWTNIGENGIEQTINYVTKTGIDQFNRLTLSTISAPLAVTLLYLKAKLVDHQTLLNWATATESGNDHFEIERSANGRDFAFLASVPGAGNSSSIQYYAYTDKNPMSGINYYRLKQVDHNSHFTYSSTVMVNAGINQGMFMMVYPNPASGNIKLSFTLLKNQEGLLQITDMSGKIVQSKAIRCIAGLSEMELNIASLPAGFYTISIAGSGLKSIPVLKK